MNIGIDPGVSGAIAFMSMPPELGTCNVHDLPTMQRGKTGNKQQLDGRAFARIIRGYKIGTPVHVYLELVKGLPRITRKGAAPISMGATSAFNFGETFGCIRGVLEALDLPYTLVPPERWKKAAGLVGAEKDASRTRAIQLFPLTAHDLERKKDVGRAEAMLIAYYGSKLT